MKRAAYAAAAAGAALVIVLVLRSVASDATEGTDFAYHALLAGPASYPDGAHAGSVDLPAGSYAFRFIPNGGSPKTLEISLSGPSFSFSEEFALEATSHETPISQYYTWDYVGQKEISVSEGQVLQVLIDPRGDDGGTVSVMLARK